MMSLKQPLTRSSNASETLVKSLSQVFFVIYKTCFQPQMGFACKFHPSCSCYAKESIQRFGIFKGAVLTLWRILRCQPLSRGGFDPVPEKRKAKHGE